MKNLLSPLLSAALLASVGCSTTPKPIGNDMTITHLNPEGMHSNPAFSQAITVDGPHRVVYVGGQNAVDGSGNIVGRGDIGAQSEQVARNLMMVLDAAGASIEHVVKWNVYFVQGQNPRAAFEAFHRVLGPMEKPPTIIVLQVAGLAHPDFLLELEAVAVTPAAN